MPLQDPTAPGARPNDSTTTAGRAALGGILLLAAICLGLATLEAAARVVLDRNGMHYGIEMWKYAKEIKRRSANPLMSHEHAPNRQARLMGVDVTTGAQGLRDRDYPLEKRADEYRILALGDSLTFGWGVPVESTYPKILERVLNRERKPGGPTYTVINAGVGNYNTVQEVAYFKERGLAYQPDEVVLGFYINDAEPIPASEDGWLRRRSYLYVLGQTGWDSLQRRFGARASYVDYYSALYTDSNPGWRECQRALEDLIQVTRQHGIRLRIVLLPELHFPNGAYPFAQAHRAVADLASRHGITALDLQDSFKGHDPKSLWVSLGDAHPNEKAMEIIAAAIYRTMSTEEQPHLRREHHE